MISAPRADTHVAITRPIEERDRPRLQRRCYFSSLLWLSIASNHRSARSHKSHDAPRGDTIFASRADVRGAISEPTVERERPRMQRAKLLPLLCCGLR